MRRLQSFQRLTIAALGVLMSIGVLTAPTFASSSQAANSAPVGVSPQVVAVSWYPWGYYSGYSACMSAGAALQASNPVFVDHKCTPGTYPNSGKYQLWMAERA